MSTVGSATYKIAKRLNKILRPFARKADSHITNTSDFGEKLEDVNTADDEVMVSYVKSLLTSVPIEEAYAAIERMIRADDEVEKRTGKGADAILKLLKTMHDDDELSVP